MQRTQPVLIVSGRSPAALADNARAFSAFLREGVAAPEEAEVGRQATSPGRPALEDVCYTAAHHSVHDAHRLVAIGGSAADMARALTSLVDGRRVDGPTVVCTGQTAGEVRRKVAFLFSGQGGQWIGMGQRLRALMPVFAREVARCDEAIRAHTGWSVRTVLDATSQEGSLLDQIEYIQPAIFTMQVALAGTLRSCGVLPDIVVGHSLGEVAAAHVAGALRLEDAVRVICGQGRALTRLSGRGAMLMVEMGIEAASAIASEYPGRLDVAVHGSARSTVLAGDVAALDEVAARLEHEHVFAQRVKVDVAGHSPHIEELREELLADFASIQPQRLQIPMLSTVTLKRCEGPELDGMYWYRNLRERVQLYGAVVELLRDGCETLVEVSPNPVVQPAVSEVIRERGATVDLLTCMRFGQDEELTFLTALASVFVGGGAVDPALLVTGLQAAAGRRVQLPAGSALGGASGPAWAGRPFLEHLHGAARERRAALIEDFVLRELAGILPVSVQEIDPHRALGELGMDSVRGVELRGRLESELRISLSSSFIWRYPTASDLSAHIYESLGLAPVREAPASAPPVRSSDDALMDELDDMDDDELARLLAEELASIQD